MARPKGSRSAEFEQRRRGIARAAMARLLRPNGASASLRELARAADVSLPTVRHYFDDRVGLVAAALDEARAQGEGWMAVGRTARLDLPLGDSVRWFLDLLVIGWDRGLGVVVSQALAAGMDEPRVGPATVDAILEPLSAALEDRLAAHRDALADGADLRHAALALLAPLVLGLLHQHNLGGRACRPLAVDTFLDDHVARWVRGWGR